jgi:hypothetical protein
VVTRLAADRPVVLVVDDLQEAGSSTLAWLTFALRRVPRLLVVATVLTGGERLVSGAQVLAVGPLSRDAVAEIVGADRAGECHYALFVRGAEVIIHNAAFDIGFLDVEMRRIGKPST